MNLRAFLKKIICIALLLAASVPTFAQQNDFKKKLQDMVKSYPATIGLAITNLQNGDTISVNGGLHLPMQSVYKFHLALAILHQVDEGKIQLNQQILIKKSDLKPDTWSPLRDKYPNGGVKIPLAELLSFTVSQSDNNGCDILFGIAGGPARVNAYIHQLGIKEINIAATENEMHQDWKVQFTNWTTAGAAADLLRLFYAKQLLSKTSQDFLWKIMTDSPSGPQKIKGLLPSGTAVAHKTGYSGADKKGLTAATNDIGIVSLPNGKHFAIAVFVSMTNADVKASDMMISELSRAAWDYFTNASVSPAAPR